jgi:hypothetical protein
MVAWFKIERLSAHQGEESFQDMPGGPGHNKEIILDALPFLSKFELQGRKEPSPVIW